MLVVLLRSIEIEISSPRCTCSRARDVAPRRVPLIDENPAAGDDELLAATNVKHARPHIGHRHAPHIRVPRVRKFRQLSEPSLTFSVISDELNREGCEI